MKTWTTLLAAAILIFLSSAAHTERAKAAEGSRAPALEVSNGSGSTSLAALRGKYVLVNFWSTSDPQSRIDNALYDRAFGNGAALGVDCISICMDSDPFLYNDILKADGLQASHQYHCTDMSASTSLSDYTPQGIAVAYLIDPEGRVAAVNPSVASVRSLVAA